MPQRRGAKNHGLLERSGGYFHPDNEDARVAYPELIDEEDEDE